MSAAQRAIAVAMIYAEGEMGGRSEATTPQPSAVPADCQAEEIASPSE